jgi:GLPGLI family protein
MALTIINVVATTINSIYDDCRLHLLKSIRCNSFCIPVTTKTLVMKIIIVLASLLLSSGINAQMKEGRIVYERTAQLPVRMFNMDPAMANQMPKARVDQFELLFNSKQSLWQFLPNVENEGDANSFQSGGAVIRFMGSSNEVSFFDFEKGTRTDQREMFDRSFVVADSIRKLEWKLTDETKPFMDYTVRKATSTRISNSMRMSMENGEMKRTAIQDTATVVAWFTTEIPVPAGPEYQGQLPGVILELDIDNGQTVYKAIEISAKVNSNKIKAPKDGKKITAAEYAREREKMMEEMRSNNPNGRIRIQQ